MSGSFKPRFPLIGIFGVIFSSIGLILLILTAVFRRIALHFAEVLDRSPAMKINEWVDFGLGILFFIPGAVMLVLAFRRMYRQKRVFQEGECILADFVGAAPDMHVTVNGRHPYIAELRGRDPFGGERSFYSDSISRDPTPQLTGRQVPVYIDRFDTGNYYVDLHSVLAED